MLRSLELGKIVPEVGDGLADELVVGHPLDLTTCWMPQGAVPHFSIPVVPWVVPSSSLKFRSHVGSAARPGVCQAGGRSTWVGLG